MTSLHKRVFPVRSALWSLVSLLPILLGGIITVVTIAELAHLVPGRPNGAAFMGGLVFLGVGLIFSSWQGGDARAWLRAPRQLQFDTQALNVGANLRIAYTDITSLRHDIGRSVLIIQYGDKRRYRLHLDIWRDDDVILNTLARAVSAHLLPDIVQRIAAGETVKFGPIGLSRDGVVYGRTTPWQDIRNIRTQTEQHAETMGYLIITTSSQTIRIDRGKIVNEPVLIDCLTAHLPH